MSDPGPWSLSRCAVRCSVALALAAVPCSCPEPVGDDDDLPALLAPEQLEGMVVDGGYRLRWADPNDGEDGYRVERRAAAGGEFEVIGDLDADAVEAIDDSFDTAAEYVYRVCAIRGDEESDPAELDSTIPYWSYMRLIGYDSLWGDDGPSMSELIGGHITYDMQARGGSYANLTLTVLGDSYGSEGTIYAHVGPDDSEVIEQPELNMGDVQTYRDFFDWVVANHPGQRYVVSYWSHGSGAAFKGADGDAVDRSIGYDDTDGDELDPEETGEALAHLAEVSGRPVELFSVCACLTQMVENAYALKDSTRFLVAGESVVGCGCDALDVFYDDPDQTTREIADATVTAHHSDGWTKDVVFSSVDLSQMDALATALDELARRLADLAAADPASADAIREIAGQTQNMDYTGTGVVYALYLDLVDLCDRLQGIDDHGVAEQAAAVSALVQDQVLTSWMLQNDGSGLYADAHGISILHPNPQYTWWDPGFYGELSFAADTYWDEYLGVIYP